MQYQQSCTFGEKVLDGDLPPLAKHHGDSKSKCEERGKEEAPIFPVWEKRVFGNQWQSGLIQYTHSFSSDDRERTRFGR